MIDLTNIKKDDNLDKDEVFLLQPREYEGSFINIHKNAIDIYLIQERMEDWVLEFFNSKLEFRYLFLENIPMLNLRWKHYQLDLPLYNSQIRSNTLNFVILQLDDMRVLSKKNYTLPSDLVEKINLDIYTIKDKTQQDIYTQLDQMEREKDAVLDNDDVLFLESI